MESLSLKAFAKLDTSTVRITDYEPINEGAARVIVRCSGNLTRDQFHEKLAASTDNKVTALPGSFRWIEKGSTAVGYVNYTPEVRSVEDKELKAKYRAVSATSNIFMDPEDESLWELSSGSSGSYLRRTQSENLPAVLSSVKAAASSYRERLSAAVVEHAPVMHTFVSMVVPHVDKAVVDYGSIVGRKKGDGSYIVFSATLKKAITVGEDQLIAFTHPDLKKWGVEVAGFSDVQAVIDYYQKAYPHGEATGYLDKLIDVIEQQAAA